MKATTARGKEMRELKRLVEPMGWRVVEKCKSGHIVLVHDATGRKHHAPSSIGDWRGLRNLVAELKLKVLTANGTALK